MKGLLAAAIVFVVTALLLFKFLPGGSAATSPQPVICHQGTNPGVFSMAKNTAPSPADIVPPWKGTAGQNWNEHNAAIFAYGCHQPPAGVVKPNPQLVQPQTLPYPVYTDGPTPPAHFRP